MTVVIKVARCTACPWYVKSEDDKDWCDLAKSTLRVLPPPAMKKPPSKTLSDDEVTAKVRTALLEQALIFPVNDEELAIFESALPTDTRDLPAALLNADAVFERGRLLLKPPPAPLMPPWCPLHIHPVRVERAT